MVLVHLNNYFRLHVCLYFHKLVGAFICHNSQFQIRAVVSQDVTDKSCLVCILGRAQTPEVYESKAVLHALQL